MNTKAGIRRVIYESISISKFRSLPTSGPEFRKGNRVQLLTSQLCFRSQPQLRLANGSTIDFKAVGA